MLLSYMQNSSSGAYKMLGDTLRHNPELLYTKFTQAVEIVLNFDAANVDACFQGKFKLTIFLNYQFFFFVLYTRQQWALLSELVLTWKVMKENVGWRFLIRFITRNPIQILYRKIVASLKLWMKSIWTFFSLGLKISLSYKFTIPFHSMWRLMEYGLYDYWKREYVRSVEKCNSNPTGNQKKSQGKAPNKPIRLIELSSAFLILGVGLSLSFFVFLMERVINMGIKIMNQRNIITVWACNTRIPPYLHFQHY